MAFAAKLELDRSSRIAVDRAATLRDGQQQPINVIVDNLSQTGCLVQADIALEEDALVSIGIPGVGRCFARISRVDPPYYGCEFLRPISEDEIAAVETARTVILGRFPRARPLASSRQLRAKLPLLGRIAIIGALTVALWGLIIGTIVVMTR